VRSDIRAIAFWILSVSKPKNRKYVQTPWSQGILKFGV